ncbi:MAG: extracellular solute-binding protein [Treponema sp.]|jgi:putative aldouronate transport system substrate-binding protein|nr:extracellular solute-binding protein [Treponema sp.]
MKNNIRIAGLSMVMVVVLAVNVFGSGGSQSRTSTGIVTIDTSVVGAAQFGVQEGVYWTDILKEDVGVQLNGINSSVENMNAMFAAQDLPELIISNNMPIITNIINAGIFIDLDQYKDKIPNILNLEKMCLYMRDNWSNGTGKLYAIRTLSSNQYNSRGGNNRGPYMRWDYYKEIGAPAINEFEDYLDVLKQIVDRHPVNEAGQKIYGMSLWNDWDGGTMNCAAEVMDYFDLEMIRGSGLNFLEYNLSTKKSNSVLDNDSVYKRGAKFLFKANQMGLLDPDSPTQGWEQRSEKATAGRVLFSSNSWAFGSFNTPAKAQQGIGTMMVPFTKEKIYNYSAPTYVGNQVYIGVNKNSKNIDKILELLNYMFSIDGYMNLQFGRRGILWDVDSSGEPYFTELYWQMQADLNLEFDNGGRPEGGWASLVTGEPPLSGLTINPAWNRRLDGADWIKKDFAPKDTALVLDWQKTMNAVDEMDYFTKHDLLAKAPFAQMPAYPDDIQILINRIGEVVRPGTWKAVMANSEAEFEAIWAQMSADAKGIGIDRVLEWTLQTYEKAAAEGSKYMW